MNPKVLIVDDEPDVLESTVILVEMLGYEAIPLSDPSEVLETVERERPGLVLQDLKMPNLSLAGLVAALRSNPATADVPVVFFSANVDVAATAARYDAWGYLPKPFGKEELSRLLEHVLGPPPSARRPRREADLGPDGRRLFREHWDTLLAITRHVEHLREVRRAGPAAERAVEALDDIVVRLEAHADRLRLRLQAMAQAQDEEPVPPRPTGQAQSTTGRAG